MNVVTPAFVGDGDGGGDTLLGFCCVRAHWPDVGSATPGSYGAVTEVYGEGSACRRSASSVGAW